MGRDEKGVFKADAPSSASDAGYGEVSEAHLDEHALQKKLDALERMTNSNTIFKESNNAEILVSQASADSGETRAILADTCSARGAISYVTSTTDGRYIRKVTYSYS